MTHVDLEKHHRENATEAAIFSAFIELSQKVTSRDSSVRSLPPFDHFKFSEIFEELDDWISNSEQGRSSGGLKGVLDRNGSNGTILTSGGSGKFCNSCGHRILKVSCKLPHASFMTVIDLVFSLSFSLPRLDSTNGGCDEFPEVAYPNIWPSICHRNGADGVTGKYSSLTHQRLVPGPQRMLFACE